MRVKMIGSLCALSLLAVVLTPSAAQSARLKDVAHVEGIRPNQLVGYGLVVGLDGTGDNQRVSFTLQSLTSVLSRMGVRVDANELVLRNVAAVMVTGTLPAMVQPGARVDVTVSAIGNARSLVGGTLLMAPLNGLDGQTYAMAQGPLQVGGFSAESGGGSRLKKNQLNVGRVPAGAIVERSLGQQLALDNEGRFRIQLNRPDFTTARLVAESINQSAGTLGATGPIATSVSSGVVAVQVPEPRRADLATFISQLEVLPVRPDQVARVIVNARTGTVVMGENVRIATVAVAHGGITVKVDDNPVVSQPAPLSQGQTNVQSVGTVDVEEKADNLHLLNESVTLSDLVNALNELGAKPRDLIDILQAISAAGALHAELEVI